MEKIVILMSTYNGEKYIKTQIDSILAQANVDFTLIIRDDGSTDSTINILNKYEQLYPQRIRLIIGKNCGFAKSFTLLVEYARVNMYNDNYFYAFSDQDDIWLKEKSYQAIRFLIQSDKNKPCCYCSATINVSDSLKPISQKKDKKKIQISKENCIVENHATGCTMVFNAKALALYADYHPSLITLHDYLMFQICVFLGNVYFDENSYILYRLHGTNQIGMPNALGRMKRRLKGNFRNHFLEINNTLFYNAYKLFFNSSDKQLLLNFIDYRKSLKRKTFLLFNRKIRLSTLEKDFFYRLKILLGTV